MSAAAEPPFPFADACEPRSLGDGTFTASLRSEWSLGGRPHGGFLTALLARTATTMLADHGEAAAEPLAVSVEFLRATHLGPALLRTDIRKAGRQTTVIAVRLEQRGRACVEGMVTVGRLPVQRALWADLPMMPAEPPANTIPLGENLGRGVFRLAEDCDVRVDGSTAPFLTGRRLRAPAGPRDPAPSLRMRLWVRPRSADVDPYFVLLAGDINPPIPFSLGRTGWSPMVQMTSFLRTRPAPGWLRVQVDCRAVYGNWFDSDATVLDSAGHLVGQVRQLAITPGP